MEFLVKTKYCHAFELFSLCKMCQVGLCFEQYSFISGPKVSKHWTVFCSDSCVCCESC